MEDYGFEYSDEEEDEGDIDIENAYYNSKGQSEEDPAGAIRGFNEVIETEGERGEWGFKALKQIVKLRHRLGDHAGMMDSYRLLLGYVKDNCVTRNKAEKVTNSLMDFIGGTSAGGLAREGSGRERVGRDEDMGVSSGGAGGGGEDGEFGEGLGAEELRRLGQLQEFYETTLEALEQARNERLWFKATLKLCRLWFEARDFTRMARVLKDLAASCKTEDGLTDDHKKGTQLLEVYALEIQVYTAKKNNKRLKQLYEKALSVKSAIPHPRIMGIIRECGGKMHMAERSWEAANTDFFEAFKQYDEAGHARRIHCLKYLVLATMLMQSDVNPFDAQEAKPYKNHPEVVAMTSLVVAYQRNEIAEFERVLKENAPSIMGDAFIRPYVEDLLKNIRTQVLLHLVRPYTRVRISFIASELNIPLDDVEALLVSLCLDNLIQASIDQINGLLVLEHAHNNDLDGTLGSRLLASAAPSGSAPDAERKPGVAGGVGGTSSRKYEAIGKWAHQLKSLNGVVLNKLQHMQMLVSSQRDRDADERDGEGHAHPGSSERPGPRDRMMHMQPSRRLPRREGRDVMGEMGEVE